MSLLLVCLLVATRVFARLRRRRLLGFPGCRGSTARVSHIEVVEYFIDIVLRHLIRIRGLLSNLLGSEFFCMGLTLEK